VKGLGLDIDRVVVQFTDQGIDAVVKGIESALILKIASVSSGVKLRIPGRTLAAYRVCFR